ncbi:MAG: hypothetical protein ABSF36_08935 [Candidatus Methanomethylicaceae archaeon]|jgi:hypothetical protein
MNRNKVYLYLVLLFLLSAIAVSSMAPPIKAAQDSDQFPSITIESYTYNGQTTQYGGGSIPVGAMIQFRVWVDINNYDPVKIAYGDGASDTYAFGGSFSHDFYHAYTSANTYVAEAFMPTDPSVSGVVYTGYSDPITISGGGSSNPGGDQITSFLGSLNPTQVVTFAVIGVIAIAFIAGGVRALATRSARAKAGAAGRSSMGKMALGKASGRTGGNGLTGGKGPIRSGPTVGQGPTYGEPVPPPASATTPEPLIGPGGGTPLGGAGAYAMPVNQGRCGVQVGVRKFGVGDVWGNGCIDQPDANYNVTITPSWVTDCLPPQTYSDHFFVTFTNPAPSYAYFDWIVWR